MTKWYVGGSICLLFLILAVAFYKPAATEITVRPAGGPTAIAGDYGEHIFWLRNDTRSVITISEVRTNVKIESTRLDDYNLNPGDMVKLLIRSRVTKDDSFTTTWISLIYNCDGLKEKRIPIEIGEVTSPLLERTFVNFGETAARLVKTVTIRNEALEDICDLESLELVPHKSNIVKPTLKVADPGSRMISLEISADPPKGLFVEDVRLTFRCQKKELEQKIECRGRIKSTLTARPELIILSWPKDASAKAVPTEVSIVQPDGAECEIVNAVVVGETADQFELEIRNRRVFLRPTSKKKFSISSDVDKSSAIRCEATSNKGIRETINIPIIVHR